VVYMNMVVHPALVQLAHQYGCAAAKQGRFAAFHHAFWKNGWEPYASASGRDTTSLQEGNFLAFAGALGLDTARLKVDANSDACKQRVAADMTELEKFKVDGTPAFFINGTHVGGGIPKAAFKQIIDDKLKEVAASGIAGADYYEQSIMRTGVKQFRSKTGTP
jgi:protein-disulfide isomerase